MDDVTRLTLLAPLVPPKPDRDGKLYDVFAERRRRVGSYRGNTVAWPCAGKTGFQPIVTIELAKAVERESEIALAHALGLEVHTIQRYRRKLGVGRINDGTARLYREYAPEKVAGEYAQALAHTPEVRARAGPKISAAKLGVSTVMSDDGWTAEEEAIALELVPSKAKALLPNRSLSAIGKKRHLLQRRQQA